MSLKYGLNLSGRKAPPPVRKPIFGDEDEEDEDEVQSLQENIQEELTSFGGDIGTPGPKKLVQPPGKHSAGLTRPTNRKSLDQNGRNEIKPDSSSAALADSRKKQAEELDPSIFDYDSFHDAKAGVIEAKKAASKQDAIERKPKYINNLMESAARRKQDQLVAREKLLQKEREKEGDEFADKEKFVTGAYKAHQEEANRIEEEERKRAAAEDEQRRRQGGGMQGFYKHMMEANELQHQEALKAAEEMGKAGGLNLGDDNSEKKTDAQIAAEYRAKGITVQLNEDGQVTDKRQLLSAGLNVTPSDHSGRPGKGGADHLRSSNQRAQPGYHKKDNVGQHAQRERQSRMLEEQLAATHKRRREEEEEEKSKIEKAAKSQKSEKDVSDAKARYLARKAAKERET